MKIKIMEQWKRFLTNKTSPLVDTKNAVFLRELPLDLGEIYQTINGFYAYCGALLFRPYSSCQEPLGIVEWNHQNLWKNAYPIDLLKIIFFGEDVFGYQFGVSDDIGVVRLDPETGSLEKIAQDVKNLLNLIESDPGEYSGDVFLIELQKSGKMLYAGERIVPKLPFVFGGEFDVENFAIMNDVKSMRIRGELATQILNVPEGETIIFHIEE